MARRSQSIQSELLDMEKTASAQIPLWIFVPPHAAVRKRVQEKIIERDLVTIGVIVYLKESGFISKITYCHKIRKRLRVRRLNLLLNRLWPGIRTRCVEERVWHSICLASSWYWNETCNKFLQKSDYQATLEEAG